MEEEERIELKTKFYDLIPDDDAHYVCENGKRIARFDSLQKAETLRATLVERAGEANEKTYDALPWPKP